MALYSSLVNMTVCAASDPVQLRQIIEKSLDYIGPLSIRIDPGKENRVLYPADTVFEIGKGYLARDGKDITIIACGEMVIFIFAYLMTGSRFSKLGHRKNLEH